MIKDGIEVYVRRTGRGTRYLEYEREKPKFNSNTSIAYIKAITGEQFEVRIKLHHGFRYYTATGLQVRLCLDANEAPDVYWHPKRFLPAEGWETVISDFCVEVGGEWLAGKLAFGEVGGGKNETTVQFERFYGFKTDPVPVNKFADTPKPTDDPDIIAACRRRLGTIRVSVQRGHVNSEDAPAPSIEIPPPQPVDYTSSISESDRASGITHKITTIDGRPVIQPESDAVTRFKAVGGPHGERLVFEFRYRSLDELTRLGLCDENGRIVEPEEAEDEEEEDVSPIPPVSRRRFSPPPKPPISKRSSQYRPRRRSPPPKLSPVKAKTPAPEPEPVDRTLNKDPGIAEKKISSLGKPPRHVEKTVPLTETDEERRARYYRLLAPMAHVMEPTAKSGEQTVLRPIKRGQGFESSAPESVKKPRLTESQRPAGPPSTTRAASGKPLPAASTTTAPRVQGSDIGIFSAVRVKREPSVEITKVSVSRPVPSAPAPSISTTRSVPNKPSVSSSQRVSSHVPARTRANAPTAQTPVPQQDPPTSTSPKSREELGIEFRALDVERELLAVKRKRAELEQRQNELEFNLRRLRAEMQVARIRKQERLAATGKID
ncbi:uncharacterized protein J3D65DRAFT_695499 [Phyllosticta citribraziliensis]|uniref:DUF7918 domain-containing protein n=1 Tax=Phyllosticta citribraziliensis TaxID=989973 RepID=A0ABR1LUG1_9PEZI